MTTDLGMELTRAILGVDRLYRMQATGSGLLDKEGLVAVVPPGVTPDGVRRVGRGGRRAGRAAPALPEIGEPLRRDFVDEMLESVATAVDGFRGLAIPYAERVERCLRVPALEASEEAGGVMDGYRAAADSALVRLGYTAGSLGERVKRWEADNRVPPAEVPAVLGEMLREARRRTEEMVFPLPPEAGEMTPVGLQKVPFSAYCDYPARQLKINLDYVYTRSSLKHLACHEAFPGHLVHMTRARAAGGAGSDAGGRASGAGEQRHQRHLRGHRRERHLLPGLGGGAGRRAGHGAEPAAVGGARATRP